MASKVTTEESQQLLQTIEMFEAIVKSQPDDYQSLEILKETYTKLGQQADSLRTSRKLAETYVKLGQISQAILEYEGILQAVPNDAVSRSALNQLSAQTSGASELPTTGTPPLPEDSKPTPPTGVAAEAAGLASITTAPGRALADALIAEKLLTPQAVEPLLRRVRDGQAVALEKKQPLTLAQLVVDDNIAKLEDVLGAMMDRSGLPYLPLSVYDVDRDIAALLPVEICLRHCVLPVDLISRSVLVVTADPFCPTLRNEVTAALDYHIFWYIAAPAEIASAIRRTHGLDSKRGGA
jgi:tetratricopeptide (TPR) repeat protein